MSLPNEVGRMALLGCDGFLAMSGTVHSTYAGPVGEDLVCLSGEKRRNVGRIETENFVLIGQFQRGERMSTGCCIDDGRDA